MGYIVYIVEHMVKGKRSSTSFDNSLLFIYLNINQLDALNFVISLFHASTCFEHMCSSSGG